MKKELLFLKVNKAPGHDNIRNVAAKNAGRKMIVALTYILNACFMLSYFPNEWKKAIAVPVPKSGKPRNSPGSYRPISLLPVFGKIFERLILARLKRHLDQSDILPEFQFGFRAFHSTCHQIHRVVSVIRSEFSKKHSTGLVLLDLQAAFDSVWHNGLIFKMIKYGFDEHIIKLVHSFLSDRLFAVKIGSSRSRWCSVPAGVPQGAVISPTLFNIYMSDIPTSPFTILAQYADDLAVMASSRGASYVLSRLQKFIDKFSKFCTDWKLKINPTKTEAVFCTRKRSPRFLPTSGVKVNGHEVNWSDHVKYLGVFLDKKLIFAKHIDKVLQRSGFCVKSLYSLLNRRSKLSHSNKLLLYKSVVRPIMLYSSPVWGSCAATHIKKVQVAQNRCLKMCLNLPYRFPTTELHRLSKVEPVAQYIAKSKVQFYHGCRISDNPLIRELAH